MTIGRPPIKAPAIIDVEATFDNQGFSAALAAGRADIMEGRDLAIRLLGQAETTRMFEEFSRTLGTSRLAFIKENKAYRSLEGMKIPGRSELSKGTWEDFCRLLGRSVDKVDEDIKNLRLFGEQALESMASMGIGYRDLRQYRRLPEDQKTALIEAATTGDKDMFLGLAEDLIAKHAKEKSEAATRIKELEEEAVAIQQVSGDKSRQIDKLRIDLSRVKKLPPDEVLAEIQHEATAMLNDTRGALIGKFSACVEAIDVHHAEHGGDSAVFLAGLVGQLQVDLNALRDRFGIPDVAPAMIPEWVNDPAFAALAKE